jgi:hypothetical protein
MQTQVKEQQRAALQDVLRLDHPTPKDNARRALFGWLNAKETARVCMNSAGILSFMFCWRQVSDGNPQSDHEPTYENSTHPLALIAGAGWLRFVERTHCDR